jgi:hypothetical protein
LHEDLALEALECEARLETQFPGKKPSDVVVTAKRFGLSARTVKREHQLCARAFPKRVLGD